MHIIKLILICTHPNICSVPKVVNNSILRTCGRWCIRMLIHDIAIIIASRDNIQ
jgi:hypothetical protein